MRYHHSVGHPVVDKDGEVVEYVGTLVDVTEQFLAKMALERENAERRRAEEELRRSEAFLAEGQRIQPDRKLGVERDYRRGLVVGGALSHFRIGF